ncbi:MAG: hypothetical protein ACKO6N_02695 [Myxococcota bacterium]
MLRPLKFWLALLVLIVPAMTVEAVTTQQKVQATPADFRQGELEQVAVTQEGRLTLAPALTRLAEIPAPILWRMGADSKGNVYLASGNEGKIYLVRAGSNKVEVLADFPETQVLALAVRPDGMVYAATAPDGKIFRLSDGTPPAVFVAPGARYVWDLLLDGKGGLLAATGSPGRVLRIAESGAIETLLKSDEEHLLSLSTDGKQQLYVGSAEEGLVYRLDLSRKDPAPFVLFDAPGNEVKQVLALPDGSVFALTLGPAGSAEPDHPLSSLLAKAASAEPVDKERLETRVYKLVERRAPELYWQSQGFSGHSLALRGQQLLLGVGEEGKLALLEGPEQSSLIADAAGEQLTALLPLPDGSVLVAASNPGALYRLEKGVAGQGRFTSAPLDSGIFAEWGRLEVRQETGSAGNVSVQTRSGNTARPGASWSEWVPYKEGVESAPARFLQYRLSLQAQGGMSPRVREVGIFFLPVNQPPKLESLTVLDPDIRVEPKEDFKSDPEPRGINRPRLPPSTPGMKEKEASGVQSLRWVASDPDGDVLTSRVQLRRAGDTAWRTVAEGLEVTFVNLSARAWPDGWYEARVTVSDMRSNRVEQAREVSQISAPFPLDHTPPTIVNAAIKVNGSSAVLRLDAQEQTTRLRSARYALNGGSMLSLFPDDKVLDENEERFSATLMDLKPGEYGLVVEVEDFVGNLSTTKLTFTVR